MAEVLTPEDGLGLELSEFYAPRLGVRYWIANGALTLNPGEIFEVDLAFAVPVIFRGFTDNPRQLTIVRAVYDDQLISDGLDIRQRPIIHGAMWGIRNDAPVRRKVPVSMLFSEAKTHRA